MANIPNTYQRLDAVPVPPETISITTAEQFLACQRLMPANTMKKGGSLEQELYGYTTTGTTIGGVILRNYIGSTVLLSTASLALTANLITPTAFHLKSYIDINPDGTVNAQGYGVLSIGGISTNIMLLNTALISGVNLSADNLLRNSIQGTGVLVGTSKIVVLMNRLKSIF